MDIFGITGTNGKTTTTWVLAEMLKAKFGDCAYVTTVEVWTGERKFYSGYTTPPTPVLKGIFGECVANGMANCVMEVSSHAIHQHRTGDTIFSGGAFTNLTEDHLDYHKTMEEYFNVKADFFRRLADSMPGAPAAICVDGGMGYEMLEVCKGLNLNTIPCGRKVSAQFEVYKEVLAKCPLVGGYNISNVLTASALAEAAGVERELILDTIPKLKSRWGRLERVECASKAEVYVDFAHTDDALSNVLSTVKEFTRGKVWAVFGAGGDRDRTKRPKMGLAASNNADCLVVTSDNPRSENPEDIIAEIVSGIPEGRAFVTQVDRAKAIYYALANAEAGDSVVICGKGHETTQEIAGVKYPFDDREIAAQFC